MSKTRIITTQAQIVFGGFGLYYSFRSSFLLDWLAGGENIRPIRLNLITIRLWVFLQKNDPKYDVQDAAVA